MKLRLPITFLFLAIFGLVQAQNCELGLLTAEPHECIGESYMLDIDLSAYANTSDNFDLYVHGDFVGAFAYADLFITVGPFDVVGDNILVFLYDQIDSLCSAQAQYNAPECSEECDFVAEVLTTECVGDSLLVTFSVSCEMGTMEFEVEGNGENYGIFSCNLPAITIPVSTEGLDVLEFVFTDLNFPNCGAEIELENPCADSTECEFEVNVLESECFGDSVIITFQVECPEDVEEYIVYGNGEEYGVFNCQNGEITIMTFSQEWNLEFVFEEVNSEDCETQISVDNPCVEIECELADVIVEAVICDSFDLYLIDIDFNHTGTSDSFLLEINGVSYGCFAYSDLIVTVGPFVSNSPDLNIYIEDKMNEGCSAEYFLQCLTSSSRQDLKEFSWTLSENEIILSKELETIERRVILSDISGRILHASFWGHNTQAHSISNENLNSGLYIASVEGHQGKKIVLIK